MPIEGASLPDSEALRALIAAQAAELAAARAGLVAKALEIETLKLQIARLRRQTFGRSSEKLGRVIGQLELSLEELEEDRAVGERADEQAAPAATSEAKRRRGRRPLPEHLPRTERGTRTGVRLSGLRRSDAQGRRGRHRDAGLHPRPVRGDPPRPPGVLLPALRDDGAGRCRACPSTAASLAPGCSRMC
jgi:Transposase C of IS166 homeodomain